jgi:hypothetical protein
METFTQPKITGHRQLSEAEVALMNEGKALAKQCGEYIAKLRTHADSTRYGVSIQDQTRSRPCPRERFPSRLIDE